MQLACFAKVFMRTSVEECLHAVRAAGIDAVQFNLSILGLDTVPEDAPAPLLARARAAFTESGVQPVALSGTFNAAHPDPAVRAQFILRFPAVCEAAAALGIPVVSLSSGSRDPNDMWRWHPDNSSLDAWAHSLATLRQVAEIAEDYAVELAIEPERNNVVSTADLALRMLEEVGSDSMGTIFDPANLLTEEVVARGGADEVIIDSARLLRGTIRLAHAKELRFPEEELPAGGGVVPWPLVIEQLNDAGYAGPLVIHGLKESDVPAALGTLEQALRVLDEPV